MTVRTRFAPSPTGYMHIGNLRTALFEYLIAKKEQGQFILRIENTDVSRVIKDAEEIIYNSLKLSGIIHDEGPDIGGPYAPYIQSERTKEYMKYARLLIDKKSAYYCFCTKDDLESIPKNAGREQKYDKHCIRLSPEEIENRLNSGVPFVIRQTIQTGFTTFDDDDGT